MRIALVAALCLVGAGPLAAEELWVAAAASLREPMGQIARRYEAVRPGERVRLSLGASSALAAQLRAGAPMDVLASADERIVDDLVARGLLDPATRRGFARNRLVAIRRPGGPTLGAPGDLLGPEVRRVAVPAGAVPVGRYAREWLARRGLLAQLEPRLVPTEHARATLAAVEHGFADAGLVYATDARLARQAELGFEIPDDEQPSIVYAAARTRDSRRPQSALHFLQLLSGAEGRAALRAAGFVVGEAGGASP